MYYRSSTCIELSYRKFICPRYFQTDSVCNSIPREPSYLSVKRTRKRVKTGHIKTCVHLSRMGTSYFPSFQRLQLKKCLYGGLKKYVSLFNNRKRQCILMSTRILLITSFWHFFVEEQFKWDEKDIGSIEIRYNARFSRQCLEHCERKALV